MSNDTAIKVENFFKRYRIGLKEEMHETLAGALTENERPPHPQPAPAPPPNHLRRRQSTVSSEQ